MADAIEAHYRPRFAGDALPEAPVACAVALADKLDALAGMFGIGQQPTGDKDPFGLRRAALGVVRILVESKLPLSLSTSWRSAFEPFKAKACAELIQFVYERFAGYLKEQGFSTLQVDAVLSMQPDQPRPRAAAARGGEGLPGAARSREPCRGEQARREHPQAGGSEGRDRFARPSATLKEPAELALYEAIAASVRAARNRSTSRATTPAT